MCHRSFVSLLVISMPLFLVFINRSVISDLFACSFSVRFIYSSFCCPHMCELPSGQNARLLRGTLMVRAEPSDRSSGARSLSAQRQKGTW